MEPNWDYNTSAGLARDHSLFCLVEGKKQCKLKPVHYGQGRQENSTAFYEWLGEVFIKHLDPDSEAGKLVLNDRCITQAAPDIRRKIQTVALGPSTPVSELLRAASSVFYNQEREEEREKEKEKRKAKRQAQLVAALQVQQPTPGCPREASPSPPPQLPRQLSSLRETRTLEDKLPGDKKPRIKVPGIASWIHHTRVKPWVATAEEKPSKDPPDSYTCKPLENLRLLFKKQAGK